MRDLESAGEWCQLERLAQVYADDLASDASGDEDGHLDHGIDPGIYNAGRTKYDPDCDTFAG